MKSWIPLSIILLTMITAVVITGIYKYSSKTPVPSTNINEIGAKKDTVQLKLVLIPEQTSLRVGEETNYAVKIKDNKLGVSAIEGNFYYDPELLEVIRIEPGGFLTNPTVLNISNDPINGKINYVLASLKYSSGEGDLFKILVKAKAPNRNLDNIMAFDRNNVEIGLRDLDKKYSYGKDEIVIIFDEQPITILP